jgi:ribose transport system substrate-binding protein
LRAQAQPYQIVGTHQAVEPVGGKRAGEQILKDFPEKGSVDVVFTVNDGGGLAVVDALASAGRDEIVVATIDGDPRSVENVRNGRLTAIDSAQFCGPLGAAAMRAAYSVLLGRPTPAHQLIPTFPITKETLSRYPGWAGPLPPAFDKPWPSHEPRWIPELREVHPR